MRRMDDRKERAGFARHAAFDRGGQRGPARAASARDSRSFRAAPGPGFRAARCRSAPVMICTSRMNRILAIDLANRRVEVAKRRGQSARHQRGQGRNGYFYRAGSFLAAGLHHRRQHRGKFRRSAYAEIRRHHQSRPGRSKLVLPDGEVVDARRTGRRSDAATTWSARWSDRRAPAGMVTRGDAAADARAARAIAPSWRLSPTWKTRLARSPKIIAAGIDAGRHRDDGPADHERGRGGVSRRLSPDAGAVLIVELDGLAVGLDERAAAAIELIARGAGASEVRSSRAMRPSAPLLWKARKRAFGAVGRLAPNYATQDGVVPRTRLPDILRVISAVSATSRPRDRKRLSRRRRQHPSDRAL